MAKKTQSKSSNSLLKEIVIQTRDSIFKTIHISLGTFKEKYEKIGKYSKDKRKNVYQKKDKYYQKENVPMNIRRYKKKDPQGWKDSGEDYNHYIQSKREQEQRQREIKYEEEQEKQEEKRRKQKIAKAKKQAGAIRVWMKLKYTGDNPLFIEAYVDGDPGDEANLIEELREFIMSNFNESIGEQSEVGVEHIAKAEKTTAEIKYKHDLIGRWDRL